MNKFQTLFEELQTDLIIFIDDDFTPVTQAGEILSFISNLNDIDYGYFETKLADNHTDLLSLLEGFRENFKLLELDSKDEKLLQIGEIIVILQNKASGGLVQQAESVCEKINEIIQKPDTDLPELIMNYGLVQFSGGITCYKPFFETINRNKPKRSIRVYKDLEGDNFNQFEKEVFEILKQSTNKYFLLIVDKVLANKNDGKAIIDDLRERDNGINTFFSILFTSDANADADPSVSLQHYLHFEVQKPQGEEDATDPVSEGLALSAYVTFFHELCNLKKSALDRANDLVSKSGKGNMLYLAEMAHAEGETVFRAIDTWFDLLVEKKINERMSQKNGDTLDFNFMLNLTSLINSNFLSMTGEKVSKDFEDEIQALTSFELFDFNINKVYSPPSAGDIYKIGEDLYILTGQDCDLIVRKGGGTVSRKETQAELVKCNFSNKLLDKKVGGNESSLILNNFLVDSVYGSLAINFNERIAYDFRLLDLCSLSSEGKSLFTEKMILDNTAKKALPKIWGDYCPILFNQINDKIKVYKFLKENSISPEFFSSDKSYLLEYIQIGDDILFPLERIARLKVQFKEYFLQSYWQYKTRKGLNTILPYNRKLTTIDSLECGFYSELKPVFNNENQIPVKPTAWFQLTGNVNRNKSPEKLEVIFSKHDILPHLTADQKNIFEQISHDEFILKDPFTDESTKTVFERHYEDNALGIKITFPYFNEISNSRFQAKPSMLLKEIFPPAFLGSQKWSTVECIIEGQSIPLFSEGKHKTFSVEDLEKGVEIPALELSFKLDKSIGVIKDTKNKNDATTGE